MLLSAACTRVVLWPDARNMSVLRHRSREAAAGRAGATTLARVLHSRRFLAAIVVCWAMPSSVALASLVPSHPVARNPADRHALSAVPIDPARYQAASRCTGHVTPGIHALVGWLSTHSIGVDWGAYRCERWSKHSASLHAEGRAEDWHLSVHNRAQRADAEHLIALFTAPDRAGNSNALARRMGIEELIWNCGYWAVGMSSFIPYGPCYDSHGRRRRIDDTTAHRDHVHIGINWGGANLKTSFWRAAPSARR